jgi:hypothetical protein
MNGGVLNLSGGFFVYVKINNRQLKGGLVYPQKSNYVIISCL